MPNFLIKEVFEDIMRRLGGKEIFIPSPVWSEIAEAQGEKQSIVLLMFYLNVAIFKINNVDWALLFGEAQKRETADDFYCDIAAIRLTVSDPGKKQIDEIRCKITEGKKFKNSLVFSTNNGRLAFSLINPLSPRVKDAAKEESSIFRTSGENNKFAWIDLPPDTVQNRIIIKALSDAIESVLKQASETAPKEPRV